MFFDSPYRALLWSEDILRPFVEMFGVSWTYYASVSNPYITVLENVVGLFLMVTAFFCLTIGAGKASKIQRYCLFVAGCFTMLHIVLKYLGHNHEFPMLLEYALQGGVPWLFLAYCKYMPASKEGVWKYPSDQLIFLTKVLLSFCFIGHGLYALGWPYQPAAFVRMMVQTFGMGFETAAHCVTAIGILDVVLGVAIFIRPLVKITLGHMFVWGGITALSRVLAYVILPAKWYNLNPWLMESSVRVAHAAVPLLLLMILKRVTEDRKRVSWHDFREVYLDRKMMVLLPLCLVVFAGAFSVHYASKQHEEQYWEQRLSLLEANKRETSQVREGRSISHRSLSVADFQESDKSGLYSDVLFTYPDTLVRVIVDGSRENKKELESLLQSFQPFYDNKEHVLEGVRHQIVEQYKKVASNKEGLEVSDEDIMRYVEKINLILDGGECLVVVVYAPWEGGRRISFEVDEFGELFGGLK